MGNNLPGAGNTRSPQSMNGGSGIYPVSRPRALSSQPPCPQGDPVPSQLWTQHHGLERMWTFKAGRSGFESRVGPRQAGGLPALQGAQLM